MEIKYLRVEQAAAALDLSVACLRAWIARRKIGIVRLGRSIRIPYTEIERLVAEGSVPAKELRNGRGL
jgi:excisionase family DNA binding protein